VSLSIKVGSPKLEASFEKQVKWREDADPLGFANMIEFLR
jgi:hypothetical protein